MQPSSSFQIVVNGHAAEPVLVHVNPDPQAIVGILKGPIHPCSERTVIEGIAVGPDIYLWNGETCRIHEFLLEWRNDDRHDLDDTFWMQIEAGDEIDVSVHRRLRSHPVFGTLAAAANVSFL